MLTFTVLVTNFPRDRSFLFISVWHHLLNFDTTIQKLINLTSRFHQFRFIVVGFYTTTSILLTFLCDLKIISFFYTFVRLFIPFVHKNVKFAVICSVTESSLQSLLKKHTLEIFLRTANCYWPGVCNEGLWLFIPRELMVMNWSIFLSFIFRSRAA